MGGMNVGRSALLGGVFGMSENVDWIGFIGWFEYGEGSTENTDSFPGELSGGLVEPPAGRTASVDACVSSFESGLESEVDSRIDRWESAESVRPISSPGRGVCEVGLVTRGSPNIVGGSASV